MNTDSIPSAQELAAAAIREALSSGAAYDAVDRAVPDSPGLGRAQLVDAVDALLRTGQITVTPAGTVAAEDPRLSVARTAVTALERLADQLVCEPATCEAADEIRAILIDWHLADDPDEPQVTMYETRRGVPEEPGALRLGTYTNATAAMRHGEDAYRNAFDVRRLDSLHWLPESGDEDAPWWLYASRGTDGDVQTEWHIAPITVRGAYDPDAEG